jgi:hypothetical protein
MTPLLVPRAWAHRLDPGVLVLETDGPALTGSWTPPPREPGLLPRLPGGCDPPTPPSPGAFSATCPTPLAGALAAPELRGEVVVHLDGATHLLTADAPVLTLAAAPDAPPLPRYLALGVPHVLGGLDHVLFVVGLALLVPRLRALVATVTAFTLAHSVTLALAALGAVTLPSGPVEACIAAELASERATWGRRAPWLIAGVFGLVHGLGFAGALAEVGLPADHAPAALFGFNLGVELGQLAIVAVAWPVGRLLARGPDHARRVPVLALGAVGTWWTLDRVASIWAG